MLISDNVSTEVDASTSGDELGEEASVSIDDSAGRFVALFIVS